MKEPKTQKGEGGLDPGRATARRCNFCGAVAPVVWVHGHGQCASCGINAEECCRGEQCEPRKIRPKTRK